MVIIRSNLNSVPNTQEATSLRCKVKTKFATCFHEWRRDSKTVTVQGCNNQYSNKIVEPIRNSQINQKQSQKHYYCKKSDQKNLAFLEKTTKSIKKFKKKLKKFFKPSVKYYQNDFGKIEIVATLLSSTLKETATTTANKFIATTATKTTTTTKAQCTKIEQTVFNEEAGTINFAKISEISAIETNTTDIMVICHDDSILVLKEEHPDIESMVRSILIARAQDGATISEIKEDYYKYTGDQFPIWRSNVVRFLLSIPHVTAVCCEQGTLLFNILPTEKTKHLYDMVLQQKNQNLPKTYFDVYRKSIQPYECNYGKYWRYDGKQYKKPIAESSSTDSNLNINKDFNDDNNENQPKDIDNETSNLQIIMPPPPPQPQLPQNLSTAVETIVQLTNDHHENVDRPITTVSDESIANNYYEDNCNYLFNRINSSQNHQQEPANLSTKPRDSCYSSIENNQRNQRFSTNTLSKMHIYFDPYSQHNMRPKNSNYFITPSVSPTDTRSSECESIFTACSDFDARLLDFPLLGDDFFLYMARMELKCKFKKNQKILQSGLCQSGQTIRAARRRIMKLEELPPNFNRSIIVNIGSVDIMQGRHLIQIEHDFRQLVDTMYSKGIRPILTTLAPLANYSHDKEIKTKLERFNQFIIREGYGLQVIDIWACLVNEKKQTHFDCFQESPRTVSGAAESYVFWNKIGRQRVLQMIEANLEY